MLKPVKLHEQDVRAAVREDLGMAKRVFAVLHAQYGAVFLSRFQSGRPNDAGQDMGVLSAMTTWAHRLAQFDERTITLALEAVEREFPGEYPPNGPQFFALCRAVAPRGRPADATKLLEMAPLLRSHYARQARAINAKHAERARARAKGDVVRQVTGDLAGLREAIADAAACAGADEATVLLGLQSGMVRRVALEVS